MSKDYDRQDSIVKEVNRLGQEGKELKSLTLIYLDLLATMNHVQGSRDT